MNCKDSLERQRHWIKDGWPTACKEAGIKDCRFHDLRATYATRILEAGYDAFTARDAAGHRDVKTTGIYARTRIERGRRLTNWPMKSRPKVVSGEFGTRAVNE